MSEFKADDVVVHPEHGRGIVQGGTVRWGARGGFSILRDVAADLRRLVVIDAECAATREARKADVLLASEAMAAYTASVRNEVADRIAAHAASRHDWAAPYIEALDVAVNIALGEDQ